MSRLTEELVDFLQRKRALQAETTRGAERRRLAPTPVTAFVHAGAIELERPPVRFIIATGSMKAALSLGVLGLVPRLRMPSRRREPSFHFMVVEQLWLTYPCRHTWMRPLVLHLRLIEVPREGKYQG